MVFNPGSDAQELSFSCTFPLPSGIRMFHQPPSMHVIVSPWDAF